MGESETEAERSIMCSPHLHALTLSKSVSHRWERPFQTWYASYIGCSNDPFRPGEKMPECLFIFLSHLLSIYVIFYNVYDVLA